MIRIVVNFPGTDYLYFGQDLQFARCSEDFEALGLSRFLYRRTVEDSVFDKQLKALEDSEMMRDKYEVARETRKGMIFYTPEKQTLYPIWTLGIDSGLELPQFARSNEMVFIGNPVRHQRVAGTNPIMKARIREVWETVQKFPDVKFVAYDRYQLQLNYLMGLAGSAYNPFRYDGMSGRPKVRTPSGNQILMKNVDRYALMEEYGITWEQSGRTEFVSVLLAMQIAGYMKSTYESIERVPSSDDKETLQEQLRKLKQTTVVEHMVQTFERPVAPYGQIWFTYGDKSMCDSCSVAFACKLYQRGAVCILPGSEGRKLASFFSSRDSNDVIEGVSRVLQFQANRFEQAATDEFEARERAVSNGDPAPDPNPEINKMANDLQKNATQYAKLINPMLMKPQLSVTVNGGNVAVEAKPATPVEMARAARELEQSGVPRISQTATMIYDHIAKKNGGNVIDESGESVEDRAF